MIVYDDVKLAAKRLSGVVVKTPLLRSVELERLVGGVVYIKPESLQKTGSFKFRGAYNRLSQIAEEDKANGVVAFSSGNHAQGVALAAHMLGIAATIIMPKDAPKIKIDRTKSHGANVVLYDRIKESREEMAQAISNDTGAILVPPFEDERIIAGQGTTAIEIFEQLKGQSVQLNNYIVPTSGGGLLAGNSIVCEALSPNTDIYSVEPSIYNDHALSFAAGKRVGIDQVAGVGICDALQVDIPGEITFGYNLPRVKAGLTVTDEEVKEAVKFALNYLNLVIEPSGATSLAAVLTGKLDCKDKTTAIILSGGNVDFSDLQEIFG